MSASNLVFDHSNVAGGMNDDLLGECQISINNTLNNSASTTKWYQLFLEGKSLTPASKIGLSFSFQGPNQGQEFRLSHQTVTQQVAQSVVYQQQPMQQSPAPAQVQQQVTEPAAQPQVMDAAAM